MSMTDMTRDHNVLRCALPIDGHVYLTSEPKLRGDVPFAVGIRTAATTGTSAWRPPDC